MIVFVDVMFLRLPWTHAPALYVFTVITVVGVWGVALKWPRISACSCRRHCVHLVQDAPYFTLTTTKSKLPITVVGVTH